MPFSTILLIGYVALEILGFGFVIRDFGFLFLLLEIILSAIVGFVILIRVDKGLLSVFNNIFEQVLGGFSFFRAVIFSYMPHIGAILLILPGIFGDVFGMILLVCSFLMKPKISQSSHTESRNYQTNDGMTNDEIIDVEIIEVTKEEKK